MPCRRLVMPSVFATLTRDQRQSLVAPASVPSRSKMTRSRAVVMAVCAFVSSFAASGTGTAHAQLFTEYPIPTANSQPWGITAGPDGNIWFTEQYGNKIG